MVMTIRKLKLFVRKKQKDFLQEEFILGAFWKYKIGY
jgi:hypothetical protein